MEKGNKKWYQSPSNIVFTIVCIILVPILLINVWIMVQSSMNKDEVPSVFGIKPFMVLSGSMENEIHKGDLIFTKIVDPTTLKEDDVIAFRDAENTVTTHRIIDVIEKEGVTYFVTKGDNNSSQDHNLVELEDVEGLYIGRFPGLGSMMDSFANPTVIIILVIGITIIFVAGFMISSKKEIEAERKEFLEYKKMKEQQEKESTTKEKTKKKSSPGDTAPEKKDGAKKKKSSK